MQCILSSFQVKITFIACSACFLLGLPCASFRGQYVLDLMDTYGAGMSVIIIAIFELVAIMWGYGVNNFCKDIKSMLGFTPSWYFKVLRLDSNKLLINQLLDLLVCCISSSLGHCIHCWMCLLDKAKLWKCCISRLGSCYR